VWVMHLAVTDDTYVLEENVAPIFRTEDVLITISLQLYAYRRHRFLTAFFMKI